MLAPRSAMAKRSYPLSKVYGLFEPRPVVLLTTWHKGIANVMTMAWHTTMEFEPPLVGLHGQNAPSSMQAPCATTSPGFCAQKAWHGQQKLDHLNGSPPPNRRRKRKSR